MGKIQHTFSDQEVTEGILAGGNSRERMADYLFNQYQGLVIQGKRKFRLSETEALDAYSDALISLLRHIQNGSFRGESSMYTYLYKIFSNKCIDQTRRNASNKAEWIQNWLREVPNIPDVSRNFLSELIKKEEVAWVEGLLSGLGETCRQLIWDADYWGYKPGEIAERMGLGSAKSAISQKYKCMKKLRTLLKTASDTQRTT